MEPLYDTNVNLVSWIEPGHHTDRAPGDCTQAPGRDHLQVVR